MSQATVIALSINGGIKTLGAYAGLAAVVALALLILLYFAHARELKRLGEQVAREAQRQRVVAAPPGAPRVAQPPGGGVRGAAVATPLPPPPQPVLGPRPAGASPLAASVEGVRRVRLPGVADGEETAQAPAASASPDVTTVSEPAPSDPPVVLLPPAPTVQDEQEPIAPRLIAEAALGLELGSVHEIGDGVLLGRGKASSIRLGDPLASGRHARVAPDGELIVLEDLGSTNGTFLNGVLISAPTPLTPGDRIRLGESQFLFEQTSVPPPTGDAPTAASEAAGEPPAAPTPQGTDEEPPAAEALGEPSSDVDAPAEPEAPAGEVPPRPAAVPLRATPVAEQSIDVRQLGAPAPAPPPPPPPPPAHADSPLIPRVGDLQQRMRRFHHGASDRDSPQEERGSRRAFGFGGDLDPALAGRRRLLILLGVLAAVAIVAVVVLINGSGGSTPTRRPVPAANTGAPPPRSHVRVTVLNATNVTGLAGKLEAQLARDGFARGQIGNRGALEDSTTIGYTPDNAPAAAEVANALGIPSTGVVALSAVEVAKATIGGARPQVVVIAGVSHPQ